MSDRLEEIKKTWADRQLIDEDIDWLIAEVERLRSDFKEAVTNFTGSEIDKCDLNEQIESLTKERDIAQNLMDEAVFAEHQIKIQKTKLEAENARLKEEIRISQGIKEGSYTGPQEGWTCYHCGVTFRKPGAASDHFGEVPRDKAKCQYHDLDVEKLEAENDSLRTQIGSHLLHLAASEKARKDLRIKLDIAENTGHDY